MRRYLVPAVVFVTALILVGSFFLPSYILALKDGKTLGKLGVTESQAVNFESKPELGIIDRLRMKVNSARLELDNGKNMDPQTAYQCVIGELEKFSTGVGLDYDFSTWEMDRYSVEFLIDSSDPSKNLIAWDITINDDEGHMLVASVDDETGVLLSFYQYFDKGYPKVVPSASDKAEALQFPDLTQLAGEIASYYGLTAEIIKDSSKKNGQIIVELSDGTSSMEMTIVVNTYGFMINM
jgi:hypothetical protein